MKKTAFKRPYKKRVSKPRFARPKVSAPIRQYVKRAIHTQLENKHALIVQNVITPTAYVFNTTMNCVSCIPSVNILQTSLGQSGRIGNQISTRSLFFNFVLYPRPYDVISNNLPTPQEVLIFIGKVKGTKINTPAIGDFNRLWQNGNTAVGPYSDLRDLTQTYNKDVFQIYKIMRFKLAFSNHEGTGNLPGQQFYANNDFKLNVVRKMNLTKHCPKILKFNDASTIPVNDNLYMWITTVNADGTTASNTQPIQMSYSFHYSYEDA